MTGLKLSIIFIILFHSNLLSQNKKESVVENFFSHEYNKFYFGTGIGIEDFLISTPKFEYAYIYDKKLIQPFAGVQLSLLVPLVAVGLNRSLYGGLCVKNISLEFGIGRSSLKSEAGLNKFNYSNFKFGYKTKYFWFKTGPTYVTNNFGNSHFVDRKLLRIENLNWNIGLVFNMKESDND